MSDYRDVVAARQIARAERSACESYGASIDDGRIGDVALALTLATCAICAELRALGTTLEYIIRDTAPQQ